jgi:adenine-specific DNA-methyltransferase
MAIAESLRRAVVATPDSLAAAIVSALRPGAACSWLDPAVGNGALTSAIATHAVEPAFIRGVDLDPDPQLGDQVASIIRGIDFLSWSAETTERFDRIIANPPYRSLTKLRPDLQAQALAIRIGNDRFVGNANYWAPFVVASIGLLNDGGHAAFILPAAYEYANYAAPVRQLLANVFQELHVHRCSQPLFERERDGCTVVIGYGYGRPSQPAHYHFHRNSDDLLEALIQPCSAAASDDEFEVPLVGHPTRPLADVLDVRIGVVTGDAGYFLLRPSQMRRLGLPESSVVPVVSHSKQLRAARITPTQWQRLYDQDERVLMFRPLESILDHPAVRAYLESGRQRGVGDRLHPRNRADWRRPQPIPADGFVSGMASVGPWIALNSVSDLTATNTLYCVRFKQRNTRAECAAICLGLLSSPARRYLSTVTRRYPDGLRKVEPGAVARTPIPLSKTARGAVRSYDEVVSCLLQHQIDRAIELADAFFGIRT